MFDTIIFVGNLGREPEMRYLSSGQGVTDFPVAVNRQYTKSSGEKVKETVWYRVSVWGNTAESCNQYLHKGSKVLVEGRLTADPDTGGPRVWDDNKGNKKASFEVNAQTVRFLSERSESKQQNDDDMPF